MDEPAEPFGLREPMPCYDVNDSLPQALDDGKCTHRRRYLTLDCPCIGELLGEDDE